MELRILGARGSFPSFGAEYNIFGHDTSCYAVVDGDYAIIMDCGSGLICGNELIRSCSRIDVFLSHVHYDHIMGLFEMRNAFDGAEVTFYGEFARWAADEKVESSGKTLCHIEELIKYNKVNIRHGQTIELPMGYRMTMYSSLHPDHTSMMVLEQAGKKLVYTGDYEHKEAFDIARIVSGCDLLLIDGTYTDEEYRRCEGWGHSRWTDCVRIAGENQVGQLVITHHNSAHKDNFLIQEETKALTMFDHVSFAKQGGVYHI